MPYLENFEHYFTTMWVDCNFAVVSLALPFLGIEMKTDLSQSCGHCWVFQICWHIGSSTFIASFFIAWNSSTENPSPPLALFLVMLPKALLTSYSRMSDSRWVITPLWLSGSWRSFFVAFFCVFLPPPVNIFSFCYVHTISIPNVTSGYYIG